MERIELTEKRFQRKVIKASKKKPVLVEFGGKWCGDCNALDADDNFKKIIAKIGGKGVKIVSYNVDRAVVDGLWAYQNPARAREAQEKGREIQIPTELSEEQKILSQFAVQNYPTFLLFHHGSPQTFYSMDSATAEQRRDRVIDSDLVVVEGPKENITRRVRPEGVRALIDSVTWYMEDLVVNSS